MKKDEKIKLKLKLWKIKKIRIIRKLIKILKEKLNLNLSNELS